MTKTIDQESQALRVSVDPRAADVFRGLWASLFYSTRTLGKGVLVCSADRREGATTIAAGLALAGSTPAGVARVALVDFNLRRPFIHEMLALSQEPGVAEIVTRGLAAKRAAQSVNPGLDAYTSGSVAGRALDVLRSGRLKGLLNALCEAYDHVLVDVAPVNHFPDAQILCGVIKDVLLVANTEQTPREAVAQAKKRLEAGGGRVVGLVLNLRTYPIPRFLYRRV